MNGRPRWRSWQMRLAMSRGTTWRASCLSLELVSELLARAHSSRRLDLIQFNSSRRQRRAWFSLGHKLDVCEGLFRLQSFQDASSIQSFSLLRFSRPSSSSSSQRRLTSAPLVVTSRMAVTVRPSQLTDRTTTNNSKNAKPETADKTKRDEVENWINFRVSAS